MFRQDPGLCPICDAPHCGCTAGGLDTIVVLSQRDALPADVPPPEIPAAPIIAEADPVTFTTSTYDRKKHGLKARR